MAATAEALINTLAGGGDAGSGEQVQDTGSGDSPGDSSAGSSGGNGSPESLAQVSGSASDNRPGEGGTPPGVPGGGNSDSKPADQVANLNAAIRETRTENKALKAQLQELTAKIEALSKPAAKVEEAPPEPDFLADPKAYVDDAKSKLAKLTEQIESEKKQQTEAQQKQQQAQETWNKVIASEQEFAAATPDYYDAINHVRGIRAEQIKVEIRETEEREPTAQEIGRILSIQEAQGAAALIAKGKNPSKFYYEYAKTFGYRPKAATTTAPAAAKPDKDAVRTMGSGGGAEHVAADEPEGALGILAAAQNEHKAQFKRRK